MEGTQTNNSNFNEVSSEKILKTMKEFEETHIEDEIIVELSFKKIPTAIENLAVRTNSAVPIIFGIPVIVNDEVPENECWVKDNKGLITKIKLYE